MNRLLQRDRASNSEILLSRLICWPVKYHMWIKTRSSINTSHKSVGCSHFYTSCDWCWMAISINLVSTQTNLQFQHIMSAATAVSWHMVSDDGMRLTVAAVSYDWVTVSLDTFSALYYHDICRLLEITMMFIFLSICLQLLTRILLGWPVSSLWVWH